MSSRACIAQLVKRRNLMQKVVSSTHARPDIKLAYSTVPILHSTGRLTVSISLVVISVQLEGSGKG
jgi:hypothetical protein